MVQVVLGVAVFVLAIAVIGLFAMMGELASRVPDPDRPTSSDAPPQPLPEARLGATPADWPAELAPVRDADLAYLLVFGSTCNTCRQIASGRTGPLDALSPAPAIVVSCPRPEAGAEFLSDHPLVADYPHMLDVGGTWLKSNFDVGVSPTVLMFARGRLQSAHTFTTASTLPAVPTLDSRLGEKV